MFRQALEDRYGAGALAEHYRAFDTICSATQDRQDAVVALLKEHPLDLMIVVGGYNSSNTLNLARICAGRAPTYHVADDDCLVSRTRSGTVRRPEGRGNGPRVDARQWTAACGPDRRRLHARQPGRRHDSQDRRLRQRLRGYPVNTPPHAVVVPRRSGGVRPPCLLGAPLSGCWFFPWPCPRWLVPRVSSGAVRQVQVGLGVDA